jgi:cytochrome c oxidase subunit III
MLFTGLFVLYAAYFKEHTADFVESGKDLSLYFGATNTILLLVSSFAVAASITSVQKGNRNLASSLLCLAWLLGGIFIFNKYHEWSHKIHLGIYPNSPKLLSGSPGRNIFFSLYYVITGLHGLHLIVGMALLTICVYMIHTKRIHAEKYVVLENSGLYWHLIDIIWIFIFPLFYLII